MKNYEVKGLNLGKEIHMQHRIFAGWPRSDAITLNERLILKKEVRVNIMNPANIFVLIWGF